MAKYTFRLLRGIYEDATGKQYRAKSAGKDKIESDEALDQRFGKDKFQRLSGSDDEPAEAPADPEEEQGPELEHMTIAQLREFAESEEIDLGTATKKDEIIHTIRAALESQ